MPGWSLVLIRSSAHRVADRVVRKLLLSFAHAGGGAAHETNQLKSWPPARPSLVQAVTAHAQESTDEITTVVVTGSHIANQEEGAPPVQVITQAQIEQTGATSAEQFLKTVSVAVQGNSNTVAASTAGVNAGGVSGVSLRGLGSQRDARVGERPSTVGWWDDHRQHIRRREQHSARRDRSCRGVQERRFRRVRK